MKRINFNIKDRKVLTLGLCLILVCVFTLTIAYAALNAVLTISGNAQVSSADWDVHLANPKVTNGSVTTTVPTLTTGKSLTFSTILNMPGDFYEFTVDVVNSGSIDAMIEKVTKTPELTADQAKYLKYEVSYANGDINDIGTIVTIGDQQFYTIGTEGDNVKLLSMYNLYVGGVYNGGWTAYGAEATGKQDSTMLGMVSGQSIRNGTTAFSNTNSTYEGSIVEGYVNNYKMILEADYGVDVVEARLITKDELTDSETFAFVEYNYCSDKYPWIYSTSYWCGSAYNANSVWIVRSDGYFVDGGYSSDVGFGVRPVIIISRSNF